MTEYVPDEVEARALECSKLSQQPFTYMPYWTKLALSFLIPVNVVTWLLVWFTAGNFFTSEFGEDIYHIEALTCVLAKPVEERSNELLMQCYEQVMGNQFDEMMP